MKRFAFLQALGGAAAVVAIPAGAVRAAAASTPFTIDVMSPDGKVIETIRNVLATPTATGQIVTGSLVAKAPVTVDGMRLRGPYGFDSYKPSRAHMTADDILNVTWTINGDVEHWSDPDHPSHRRGR